MTPKQSDERSTPQALFDRLNAKYGPFDLDVCATKGNAKCQRSYTIDNDGLIRPWDGRIWCNPPYSRGEQAKWVRKAIAEVRERNAESVTMLLPADTSTALWHDLVLPNAAHIEFLRGRQKFNGAESGAKFGSAVVIFKRAGSGQLKLFPGAALAPKQPEPDVRAMLQEGEELSKEIARRTAPMKRGPWKP